jgi:hypothetical protein
MLAVCARAIALVWRKSAGERAEVIGEDSAAEIGAGGRGRSGFAHELGSVFEIVPSPLPGFAYNASLRTTRHGSKRSEVSVLHFWPPR